MAWVYPDIILVGRRLFEAHNISDCLASAGYSVGIASDSVEAARLLEQGLIPQVLIIGIADEGEKELALARWIRGMRSYGHIPIIGIVEGDVGISEKDRVLFDTSMGLDAKELMKVIGGMNLIKTYGSPDQGPAD